MSSHLGRTILVNKGFIIWLSGKSFLRDTAGSPERADGARSGSQSQQLAIYKMAYYHTRKAAKQPWGASIQPKILKRDSFQIIRKLLNFRKANRSTENSGNSERKVKWNTISR